jgi:LysM repeat protein
MDSISKAEKKSTGPKFPGYWKGGDSADKSRSRMVGDESVIPQLAKQAKEKTLEWQIEEAYQQFKEQEAVVEVERPAPYRGSAGSQEIQKLNPSIKDVNKIQAGQTFKMPDGSNYTVKPGDTLDKIARRSSKGDQPRQYRQLTTDPTAGEAQDKAAQAAADVDARTPDFVPPPPARRGNSASIRPPAGTVQRNEAVNKLAEQFAAFMEAQDEYGPEYQAMVRRVGDRARQGAMKTVWDPVKRVYKNVPVKQTKSVKEYENAQSQDSQITSPPAPDATAASKQFVTDKELQNMNAQKTLEADAGAQDPNKQTTSPPSPAAVAKPVVTAAPDVSVATARTTMAGLKPALGPGVDTNAAATGVTKANLGQQLNPAEQQAVSAITPLVMKAATIPSAAPQLRSALTNAGAMAKASAAKQGKM